MPRYPLALALLTLVSLSAESRAAGLLVPRDGSPPIAVRSHRVTAEMRDGLARTTLRQTFVNPHALPLEAVYVFPLPEGAVLVDVAMEVDGERLEGLLVERKTARRIYEDIVRQRRDPALVEQIGREVFRLSVFPVLPKKPTVVEITWIELIPLSQGVFRYVYPLSLGRGKAETEQDFTFSITLGSSVPLSSVTSTAADLELIRQGPNCVRGSLERMRAPLSEDIVLEARVRVTEPTLTVATFRKEEGDGWFLAIVTPPEAREEDLVPRDVILVVDTSGSMRGRKIEQARSAADTLLRNLRSVDRVNVIGFSSVPVPFGKEPVPVTPESLGKLREFVKKFRASGGTALGDALELALDVPPAEGRVRTVVLLTDGLPTIGEQDPAKIVGLAREGRERGLRVFCFGVGEDVDPALLRGISSASRARAEIFKPTDQIESRLTAFLSRTASPVIANIDLDVYDLWTHDLFPRPVPDAYLGEQVILAGRYRGGGSKVVSVSATVGGRRARLAATAEFRTSPGGSPAVASLFARQKLAFLEEAIRLRAGLSDDAYYAALDRGAYSTRDEIQEEMISVSLEHGVQCAYTSFLVLLPEDRRRIDPRSAESIAAATARAKKARARVTSDLGPLAAVPAPAPGSRRASTKVSPHFFGSGGGSSRGPAGEVVPGMRDPRDAQPPAERPGPGIPPPGGPASPPPAVGGAPAPGGTRSFGPKPVTFAHWLFWWAHNKDEILHRRTAGRPPLPEEAVRKEIVPALLAVIADDRLHPHIRSEALLALGRSGRAGEHFELVAKHARDWDSGAILALGLLPAKDHPEAGRLLIAKLDDEAAPTRARCFAALSLGLRGEASPEVLACLTRRLDGREAAPDVRVIALLALGLLGNPAPAPDLVRRLEARGPTDLEKAHIIGALGRIGDPAALKPVTAVLRRKGLLARRSAAIALGRLGLEGDAGSRLRHAKLLGRSIRAEGDEAARNFALISLGRFASDPRVEASLHGFCTKALLDHYEKAGRATSGRAHAALALALMSPGDGPVAERLRRDLESRGGSLTRGALALALGIMGDDSKATIALLSRMLGDRGLEKKIRAAAALSLGLLGGPEAGEAVRKALGEREDRDLRMDTATAAGLLGDAEAVPLLLAIFEDQKASVFVLGAAAWSLGRIGDPSAVAALRRILEPGAKDGAYPDLCRAMAANALGQLAARPENRVFHRISADLNYRASVPALDAILAVR